MAGLGIKAVNARPEAKVCLTGMESESLLRSVMPALPMFRKGISSTRRAADFTTKMKLRGSCRNDWFSEKPRSFFAGASTSLKYRITSNPTPAHVCRADSLDTIRETSNLDNGTINGIWERVQLLERQLGVAVTEENYSEASRIRDQLTSLKSKLTPGEQFLLTYSARSRSGSLGQRMTALAAMGELGDHRALPVLLEGLRDNNPLVVEQTEKAMWKIFMRSGREDIDRKLQDGIDLLMTKDGYRKAKNILTEIISEAPSFAEGFNKRATVNYLLEEYDEAIKDCHSTLQLNPYHFGALSGMGLCYAARRELEAALFWFEKALALHPGLHLQIGKYIEALKQKIAHRKGNVEGDHK
ncbi:uncharacterized protein [Physcomitrium patens]|uniref:UVR domain-containing protein n=1 Tax=Physcomitrium patens TaxID=3218 RepID=A0A7I4BB91_PHYPA|nr:uncharacterized protein LOC112293445 isoform X1 [Physcomitrium patens]|eukprot:XP_024398614.1 uncharacterized protein LOC112293445 isoform X1 [Physcomitrella patens]